MSWYKTYMQKEARDLEPDAWRTDEKPHRLMQDQDEVYSPYGGTIRQKQDPKELEEKYTGVHLTFSPEIAAIYANGKATIDDSPVIIELDGSNMEKELDVDAQRDFSINTYISEKQDEWRQLLLEIDNGEITPDDFAEKVYDGIEADEMYNDGEYGDDSGDIIARENRPSAPAILQEDFQILAAEQIVQRIRDILNGQIPKEWYMQSVSQFRVLNPIGSNKVKAIYKIPFINFSELYNGDLSYIDDDELEDKNYSKREDGSVIDSEGRIILDSEDMQYSSWWLTKEALYENDSNEFGDSVWHGTNLSNAQQAYPEIFGIEQIASTTKWYKMSQQSRSIEEIAKYVRDSLLKDDHDTLRALCLPVSRHLAKILIDNGYGAANVVRGTFTVDTPDLNAEEEWDVEDFGGDYDMMEEAKYTPLHYWVQINNMVIDITADQFNNEMESPIIKEVEIGDINSMERYNVITENFIDPKIMH